MTIVERVVRYPYNFILRHGPSGLKSFFWNREFASGKWNFIDNTSGDYVYPYIEKYAANGTILDLGCGPGNTANELAPTTYKTYVGVDISEVALAKARTRSQQNGRTEKNVFVCGDFVSYVPTNQFDVILFRESLYHVSIGQVKSVVDRYSQHLRDGGVFIVRIITGGRYTSMAKVRVIETEFEVVEKEQHGEEGVTVVVFRPRRPPA